MKKAIKKLLVLSMALGILVGCGGKTGETGDKSGKNDTAVTSQQVKLVEKDGLLTYTDTKNSPFEESGLKISIKKGNEGYAKFIKTDLNGGETVEYYNFDYGKNIAEKYYYVSAMGTGFYYYYDLEKGELVKVEDKEHNDTTQKTKDSKRWDKAAESMDEEVKALEKYFKEQFSMTIKETVTK